MIGRGGECEHHRRAATWGVVDPELAVWSCRVYNDWIVDWCSSAPDRLKGVGALPMQDPIEAAAEVHRIQDAK